MIEYVADALLRADDIVVIAHTSPDGDTLGSSLALYSVLKKMGKRVKVACDSPVPHVYRFLPNAAEMRLPQEVSAQTAVAVDCADRGRLGGCAQLFDNALTTFNIDHHMTNTRFAQYNAVFDCSATGECILDLLYALDVRLDRDIATCLFTAISTDTGHFSYSNTSGGCLRATARLVEQGIDVMSLTARLYRTRKLSHTRLIGRLISRMALYEDGKIAIGYLGEQDFIDCGAVEEDTEGLIEHLRNIEGVELAAILRQSGDEIRVSLRSSNGVSVAAIAQIHNGGGHMRAAGCSLYMPMEQAEAIIRGELIHALHTAP